MAMMAPTGMATNPANSKAASHGMCQSAVKCPNAAAPTAAKARWHSEICPEVLTKSPSDKKSMT